MRSWHSLGIIGLVCMSLSAGNAAELGGKSFKITLYLLPHLKESGAGTQCIVFEKTGGVLGASDRGTWTDSTFSAFLVVQIGDEITMSGNNGNSYGFSLNGSFNTNKSFTGRIVGVDNSNQNGNFAYAGTAVAEAVPSC